MPYRFMVDILPSCSLHFSYGSLNAFVHTRQVRNLSMTVTFANAVIEVRSTASSVLVLRQDNVLAIRVSSRYALRDGLTKSSTTVYYVLFFSRESTRLNQSPGSAVLAHHSE